MVWVRIGIGVSCNVVKGSKGSFRAHSGGVRLGQFYYNHNTTIAVQLPPKVQCSGFDLMIRDAKITYHGIYFNDRSNGEYSSLQITASSTATIRRALSSFFLH